MGHGFERTDNFAFTGERGRIWHGIGHQIEEGQTAREVMPKVGLGWDTELAPIYAEIRVGGTDDEPELVRVALPEHKAHVRMDTHYPLGVVSNGYEQITNADFADFIDRLAGQDAAATIDTVGSLYNGRRIFACVKLPHVIRIGADINEEFVIVSNGHGGFASFSCYPTSLRVVCNNTLRWSERDAGKGVQFRHSGNMAEKIEQARTVLGIALEESKRFEAQVIALAGHNLSVGQARDFMTMTYDATFGKLPDPEKQPEAYAKLLEKRTNTIDQWLANMELPEQQIPETRGTLWAGLNAITYWHDHQRGRYKPATESGARLHSNLFGAANRDKQRAMRTALTLVG